MEVDRTTSMRRAVREDRGPERQSGSKRGHVMKNSPSSTAKELSSSSQRRTANTKGLGRDRLSGQLVTADQPLVIAEQGSFAAGGTVIRNPGSFDPYHPTPVGQTLHGDHAYVFYQRPVRARKLPLVFWHGLGQFSKTWETTPDGREGFQMLFLRRRFAVYVIDQPRRGNAGRSTVTATVTATPDEQEWFDTFRLGIWPNFFPGVQFPRGAKALDQFFRQMTPNVGPYYVDVNSRAVSALFDEIGPGILVTHSQSGGQGWVTAIRNPNVRGIVAGYLLVPWNVEKQ